MTDFRRGSHQSTQSVNFGRNSNQTRRPLSAGAIVTPKRRRPQQDVALANPEESEYFFDQDPLREIQMRQSNPSQARGIGSESNRENIVLEHLSLVIFGCSYIRKKHR